MLTSFDPRIHKQSASTKLSVTSDETQHVRKPQAAHKLMLKSRKAASSMGRRADPLQSLSPAVAPSWRRAPANRTPNATIPYLMEEWAAWGGPDGAILQPGHKGRARSLPRSSAADLASSLPAPRTRHGEVGRVNSELHFPK